MKKFLVFVMICIVTLGIAFTAVRFGTKKETLTIGSYAYELNSGDFEYLDIQLKNAKSGTKITVTSSDPNIVSVDTTDKDGYKITANKGGDATISVESNIKGATVQKIKVSVGDGEIRPFYISSTEDFKRIGNDDIFKADKDYQLQTNLSFAGTEYAPIASFSGNFNFGGYTLSGISIDSGKINCAGLFGTLASTAVVENLKVSNLQISGVAVSGTVARGAIAGINKGTIRNVYAQNVEISDSNSTAYVGGLVGENFGTIRNSAVDSATITCDTTSNTVAGGLVGANETTSGNIFECFAMANVTAGAYVGGLAGENNSASIEECYAGSLNTVYNISGSASTYIGGLVGWNKMGKVLSTVVGRATIADCYSLMSFGEEGNRGAIVGKNTNVALSKDVSENPIYGCYYVSGDFDVAANMTDFNKGYANSSKLSKYIYGYTTDVLTTQQDKYISYYTEDENGDSVAEPWQFDSIWLFESGKMPQLNLDNFAGSSTVPGFIKATQELGSIPTTTVDGVTYIDTDNVSPDGNYAVKRDMTITKPIDSFSGNLYGEFDKSTKTYPTITVKLDKNSVANKDYAAMFGTLTGSVSNLNFKIEIKGVTSTKVVYYAGIAARNSGKIDNCTTVDGSQITITTKTAQNVGGLVATNQQGGNSGVVSNSTNNCSILFNGTTGTAYIGGIVGNNSSALTNVENNGTITSNSTFAGYIGGIAGRTSTNISKATNNGAIKAYTDDSNESYAVGGIVGVIEYGGSIITVELSANHGDIESTNVGGVVGLANADSSAKSSKIVVSQCLSSAKLSGLKVGGLAYKLAMGTLLNCLSKNNLTGTNSSTSVLAGLVYDMLVTSTGAVKAEACLCNNEFSSANVCYYEDANRTVHPSTKDSNDPLAGLRGERQNDGVPQMLYADALKSCFAIKKDGDIKRTNGEDSLIAIIDWTRGVQVKKDNLGDGDSTELTTAMISGKETKIVYMHINGSEVTEQIDGTAFSSQIWKLYNESHELLNAGDVCLLNVQ